MKCRKPKRPRRKLSMLIRRSPKRTRRERLCKLAYDWDWLGAQSDFQQALKLNPKYPTAHQWYASYLMQMGKFNLAKAEIEEAHKLDPLSPIINSNPVSIPTTNTTTTTRSRNTSRRCKAIRISGWRVITSR